MNTIFETITDATLRRVYKLVLKRSIGKYLEDELLIDQLEVQSREGKFAIHNLRLSADLLNAELFCKTPVKLMSLEIEELNVAISYSSLVSDGLQVNVTSVNIHFCPNKNIVTVDREEDESDEDEQDETVQPPKTVDTTTSDEGREGLSFIGTWIEVIVAKLRAKIDCVNIFLHPEDSIHDDSPSIVLRLNNLSFFNADPSGDAQASSMQLSQSVMSSLHQSATLTALSSTKVIEIEHISISITENQNAMDSVDILKITGKVQTKIRLKADKDVDLDLSVTVPMMCINLEKNLINKISTISMKFISSIEKNVSDTRLQEAVAFAIERRPKIAAKYLLEIENDIKAKQKLLKATDKESENFVSNLIPQMRNLHKSSQRVPFSANALQASSLFNDQDHVSIDSDGDFPSSDEEDFFDAQEFGTKSHSQFTSALRTSRLGRSKISYYSESTPPALIKESCIKFNLFVVNASVEIVDCEQQERKLILSLAETVLTIDSKTNSEKNMSDILDVSVQATTNTLELVDQTLELETPSQNQLKKRLVIVSFSKLHDAATIYGTPDLSLGVKYFHDKLATSTNSQGISSKSTVPTIEVDVTFGSIVIGASAQQIAYWGKVGSSLFTIEVASEPTTTKMNFNLKIPSIELFFHSDDRIADTVWEDINTALMLDACRDNWTKINFNKRPYLRKHLIGAKGGLNFLVKGLHVSVTSLSGPLPSSSQNIEMDRITLSIFIDASGVGSNREVLFLKSAIISAFADENPAGEKIYVKKCSDRSFGRQGASNKHTVEGDDMGPSPPYVDIGHIVFIRTHKLFFEVEQREFHALMMIGDTLVVSNKETVIVEDSLTFDIPEVPVNEDDPSFGLQISTAFATLAFSENSRNFWETYDISTVPNSVCGGAVRNLVKLLREMTPSLNLAERKTDSKLKLCVSIRDPKMELYSVEGQIFVSMTADDLSVYELTPSTYKELVKEGFNFHRSKDWNGVRVGAQRHRIPFIRRAFVPVDDGKGKGSGSVGNSVLLSDHSRYGHAFEVRLCLSHENQQFRDFAAIKSVHFFIDFYDILINHDPTSTWFFQLINIMTPQSAEQMIQNNIDDIVTQLQKYENSWSDHQRKIIGDILNTLTVSSSTHSLLASHISDTGGRKVIATPFEVTKISVRVRDSMMDYSHVEMNSRIILSVGLIAISSTIASNSDRVTLKLSLSALTFYACNDIVTDKDSVSKEISTDRMGNNSVNDISNNQSLLRQWMHQNNFVNLLDIDYLTNLVTLNETEQDELSLRFTLGNCTISGCYDSLVIFKNALGQWFKEFEYSCGQSETILRKKKKKYYDSRGVELDAVKLGEGCIGDLDRVRFCDDISEDGNQCENYGDGSNLNETEMVRIPDELLQSRFPMGPAYDSQLNENLHQSYSLNTSFMKQSRLAGGTVPLNILEKYYDYRMEDDVPEYSGEIMNDLLQRSRFVDDWAVQDIDPKFEDLLEHDPDAPLAVRPQPSFEADYGYGTYDNDTASEVPSISTAFAPNIKAKMRLEKVQQRSLKANFDADEVSSETGDHPIDGNDGIYGDDDNTVDSSVLSAYGGGTLMNLQPLKQNLATSNKINHNNNNLTISRMFFNDVRHQTPEPVELRSFGQQNMEMIQSYDEHDNHEMNPNDNMMGESKISALGTSDMNNAASFDIYDHHVDGAEDNRNRVDERSDAYFDKRKDSKRHYSPTNVPGPVSISEYSKIPTPSKKATNIATTISRPVAAVTQPGLGKQILEEMHEVDVAWEKIDHSVSQEHQRPYGDHGYQLSRKQQVEADRLRDTSLPFTVEQETRWYVPQSQIDIQTHYIPVFASGSGNDIVDGVVEDHRPASERQLATKVFVQLNGNFKLRLHEGTQWQQTSISQTEEKTAVTPPDHLADGKSMDTAPQRNEKVNKSVTFAPAETATVDNSNKPPKKPALFPQSSKKKAVAKAELSSESKSEQSVKSQSRLVPLDERYSLDVFLKRISVQVSIYDHPSGASNLTAMNLRGADSADGWKDFDVDGHTVQSAPTNTHNTPAVDTILPHERITVSVQDFLITYGHSDTRHVTSNNQRRKKVLGYWQSSQHPRDQAKPMVHVSLLGYRDASRVAPQLLPTGGTQREEGDLAGSSEYRVHGAALPLRLFLSDEVVQFVRQLVDDNVSRHQTAAVDNGDTRTDATINSSSSSSSCQKPAEPTDAYFQQVTLAALALKIDYRASAVNLRALQQGDYLQLLNIFPIDGLEITLAAQKLQGVDGSAQLTDTLLRHWVQDIYANQLHRVLSGAAPLKSLSNIGKDLQGLLYIPAAQLPRSKAGATPSSTSLSHTTPSSSARANASVSRNNQAVLRHLQKGTKTLLSTVARETLDVSHKLTMFVAQTITDLATPETLVSGKDTATNNTSSSTSSSSNNNSVNNTVSAVNHSATQAARHTMQDNLVQQPRGLSEGLTRAYEAVSRELSVAAETVIAVPVRQYESLGPSGLISSVVRALPIAVLRPVAGVAEGLSYTILGLRNALDPETQRDEEDLWNVDLPLN